MRSTIKYSASLAAASLLAALIGGCAGHANEQQPVATTTTTTTSGTGTVSSGSTAPVDDVALTSNVQTTLANTPGVNANEINVQSSDGVVTLSGDVDSASAASAAVQAAQGVNGVTSVHNDLTVVNPPQG
ncbi:MAG TPA: BON domain-containing protein [Gammaproteobacteria bacterium]|jgi:hyperosmotically inducible protein|nr:BON domain-containing protein [Gammaproteobacteria bacterium]